MKEINYWEQFMQTGKVSDFLAYKNATRDEKKTRDRENEPGEHFHAGVYRDYGNGFKG